MNYITIVYNYVTIKNLICLSLLCVFISCVAVANKNNRILWAVKTREDGFDPKHVSVKPQAKQPERQPVVDPALISATCAA